MGNKVLGHLWLPGIKSATGGLKLKKTGRTRPHRSSTQPQGNFSRSDKFITKSVT